MNMIDSHPVGPFPETAPGPDGSWAVPLVALALALAAWGTLFAAEIVAAVAVWDSSTAYNHCWLILPIAPWPGWPRAGQAVGVFPPPRPGPNRQDLPLWIA